MGPTLVAPTGSTTTVVPTDTTHVTLTSRGGSLAEQGAEEEAVTSRVRGRVIIAVTAGGPTAATTGSAVDTLRVENDAVARRPRRSLIATVAVPVRFTLTAAAAMVCGPAVVRGASAAASSAEEFAPAAHEMVARGYPTVGTAVKERASHGPTTAAPTTTTDGGGPATSGDCSSAVPVTGTPHHRGGVAASSAYVDAANNDGAGEICDPTRSPRGVPTLTASTVPFSLSPHWAPAPRRSAAARKALHAAQSAVWGGCVAVGAEKRAKRKTPSLK